MAYGDNSDKLIIRIPPELVAALRRLAKKARGGKGLTLSEYVREILQAKVNEKGK